VTKPHQLGLSVSKPGRPPLAFLGCCVGHFDALWSARMARDIRISMDPSPALVHNLPIPSLRRVISGERCYMRCVSMDVCRGLKSGEGCLGHPPFWLG